MKNWLSEFYRDVKGKWLALSSKTHGLYDIMTHEANMKFF